MSEHPSHYALDRVVLGTPLRAEVAVHVGQCARCAAVIAARRAQEPPPAWVATVAVRPHAVRIRTRHRSWRWWLLPMPAVVALGTLLAVAPWFRSEHATSPAEAIRSKGAPVVTVYVKRGERVTAWDGRTPLRAGDRLRLAVRGAGYAHVSIVSLSPAPDAPALLYAGPLERDAETMPPVSFRVDERGGDEVLSVILSMRPIAVSEHTRSPERRERDLWGTRLQLLKEVEQ